MKLIWFYCIINVILFNHVIILIFVHVINFRETVSRNIVHFFLSINHCLYGVINLKFELQNFNSSSLALTLQNSEQLQMIRLQKFIFTVFAFQSFIYNYLYMYYRPYIISIRTVMKSSYNKNLRQYRKFGYYLYSHQN